MYKIKSRKSGKRRADSNLLTPASLLLAPEWLHAAPHRCQKEPNGHWDHTAGVRCRHQRRDAARHQPHSPGSARGQCGPGVTTAGQER